MASAATYTGSVAQTAKPDVNEESVLQALNNEQYVWRTLNGLSKETQLPESDVLATLNSFPADTLAVSKNRDGMLYTTRDHYYKKQSFLGRFLTAATGRFK